MPDPRHRRIPVSELAFPVLLMQREAFFVWPDASSVRPLTGSLIDSRGLCYQMVSLEPPPPWHISYSGEPVQVSLDRVRESIVWLVSAAGHFEIPQGLPSTIDYVNSIDDLLSVLIAAGWSSYPGVPLLNF